MTTQTFLGLLALLFIILGPSCSQSIEDKEARIVDLKTERNEVLSDLWQLYGGSDLVRTAYDQAKPAIEDEARRNPDAAPMLKAIADVAEGTLVQSDREIFEQYCRELGAGKRPRALSKNARRFFEKSEAIDGCKRVVALERKVAALKEEIASEQSKP